MVESIRMGPSTKYLAMLSFSFFLWIVPVSIKAPRLSVLCSLLASCYGFVYCYRMADELHEESQSKNRLKLQRDELTSYQFALEEEAIKQQLFLQFFPPQPEPTTVNVQAQPAQQLPQGQTATVELPEHLQLILNCALENEGACTVRQVQRYPGLANKLTADEVKACFQELEAMGYGTVVIDKNRLIFELS